MDMKVFHKRIETKDFEKLENDLLKVIREKNDLHCKYLLAICYSEQVSKRKKAVSLFKELMNTNQNHPYIYFYVARQSDAVTEKIKIINAGLNCFPKNELLNNQLLFHLDGKDKEGHFEKNKKEEIFKDSGLIEMISYYYGINEHASAIKIIEKLDCSDYPYKQRFFKFLEIVLNYINGNLVDSNEMNSLIITDDNTLQGYILKLVEIDICEDKDKQLQLLQQISYFPEDNDPVIGIIDSSDYNDSYFAIENLLYDIIDNLKEKIVDPNYVRKLDLIKYSQILDVNLPKKELNKIAKAIEDEVKLIKNSSLYSKLLEVYDYSGNNKKYFNTYMIYIENYRNDDEIINFERFTDEEISYAVDYIVYNIEIFDFNANRYNNVLKKLISQLHASKKYESIIEILDSIDYQKIDYLAIGFEIAFAFKNANRVSEAKKIYKDYLKKFPKSASALNNLGVIYEKEKKYAKALQLYEKSEKLDHDEIYVNNINRCKELIEEEKQNLILEQKALESFFEENIWVIGRIKNLYSEANDAGDIICAYKSLPTLMKCSEEKANDLLKQMLEKGYIFRNNNHDYNINANVYKKNNLVAIRIKELEKQNMLVKAMTDNLNNFTIKALEELEYGKIIKKLSGVGNDDIKKMFIRDYNEFVFNYLTNQCKSTILMAGTLVELLLLYSLEKKGILQHKVGSTPKNKKIGEMDLSELLTVCNDNNILHTIPKKFIDGMKHFRNFVHPGIELKDKRINLNKTTIEMSVSVVSWLILSLDL